MRSRLGKAPAIVAEKGGIVGVLTTAITAVLHWPRPVGRISMMVVAEEARGAGIGAALVAEAEKRLAAKGCGLVEVTSNRKRQRAHAFYEKLGYERTVLSLRQAALSPTSFQRKLESPLFFSTSAKAKRFQLSLE